jgi:hypothetical protein
MHLKNVYLDLDSIFQCGWFLQEGEAAEVEFQESVKAEGDSQGAVGEAERPMKKTKVSIDDIDTSHFAPLPHQTSRPPPPFNQSVILNP